MKVRLTEQQLEYIVKHGVTESCKTLMEENGINQFDNITDEDLAQYQGNFYVAIVPEWALQGLLYDYYEGLTDWQVMDIKGFKRNFITGTLKLPEGINFEDICKPLPGVRPAQYQRNDVGGKEDCLCYKFAFPAR